MNVLEVGTELKIKNMEFSFHFLSTLIWSPGSAEYSFHFYSGMREMAYLLFHRAVPCLSLPLSPLPHKNQLSFYPISQGLQITAKSSCEALPLRICTDQNLKCLLA